MNYFIQHSGLLNNVTLVLTKTTFSIIWIYIECISYLVKY
jgi:hypothetical protein